MSTPLDQLLEQLENVPYTSSEQELCFAAADEIERLREELEAAQTAIRAWIEMLGEGLDR